MKHIDEFRTHGFAILPGWVPKQDIVDLSVELTDLHPSAADFHNAPESAGNRRYLHDEFAGIDTFPFQSTGLNLLAVHAGLVQLAEAFLETTDIRIYTAELWAKYTGAADYNQPFHRDFLNHTVLVPRPGQKQDQVEMFLFLNDVDESLGPPHFVSKAVTGYEDPFPNWLGPEDRPAWYAAERSSAGPAGTVAAFGIDTFHRATDLVQEKGARYTLHVAFRTAASEWASRIGWANRSHEKAWYEFVSSASLRQLLLFGFPPPGHEYWTPETLKYVRLRYPGLDVARFQ